MSAGEWIRMEMIDTGAGIPLTDENGGTPFPIYLPAAASNPSWTPSDDLSTIPAVTGELILTVEDDAAAREALLDSLELLNLDEAPRAQPARVIDWLRNPSALTNSVRHLNVPSGPLLVSGRCACRPIRPRFRVLDKEELCAADSA
jgi:hypothetical protein